MSLAVRMGHCSTTAHPATRLVPKASSIASAFSLLCLCAILASSQRLFSAGSGLNTLVVVNQNSTNSVELGNYYAEARGIGPEKILRISWSGGNTSWTESDYTNTLLNPLLAMLSSNGLTNQIDYVVLSMDIPFTIIRGTNNLNSTTSALFYGLKPDANG